MTVLVAAPRSLPPFLVNPLVGFPVELANDAVLKLRELEAVLDSSSRAGKASFEKLPALEGWDELPASDTWSNTWVCWPKEDDMGTTAGVVSVVEEYDPVE
jgi:hypothetical protein